MGAFTTRAGGLSGAPWDSLNLALHVDDEPRRVAANRSRLARGVGRHPRDLVFAQQVHGRGVAVVDLATERGDGLGGVDALVTAVPGPALLVLAADCLPVLLADPVAGVVAVAHAGRQGLAAGVLAHALDAMSGLGARADRVVAVLGPAVCGACYELPAAVADEVGRAVPGSRATTRTGTPSVDLAAGAETTLRARGVRTVTRVGGCTVEQPERFYSYRRDGLTGRHAGLVWIDTGAGRG